MNHYKGYHRQQLTRFGSLVTKLVTNGFTHFASIRITTADTHIYTQVLSCVTELGELILGKVALGFVNGKSSVWSRRLCVSRS